MRCDRAKEDARVAGAGRATAVFAFERAAFITVKDSARAMASA